MPQRRHIAIAALLGLSLALGLAACGRTGAKPPGGELRSTLVAPTLAGVEFDPAGLGGKVTMVMFWSPG